MWEITWPDGHVDRARDAEALLTVVAADQWTRMDVTEVRRELASRAMVWSDARVDPTLPAAQFWRALADAGMLAITASTEAVA
ncbi:MAG: hypothetical protein ACOYY2_12875 [Actinomycetota bacterium]